MSGAPSRIPKNLPKPVKRQREGMSSAHLKLIRALPCIVTGTVGGVDAHHLLKSGEHGMGRKSSDRWAVPLRADQHRALHDFGNEDEWFAERGIDARALAKALWASTGDIAAMWRIVFRARQEVELRAAARRIGDSA